MGWVGVWDRERLIGIFKPEVLRKRKGLVGSTMKEGRKGLVTLIIFSGQKRKEGKTLTYFLEIVNYET